MIGAIIPFHTPPWTSLSNTSLSFTKHQFLWQLIIIYFQTEPIGIKLSCKTCGKSFNLLKALIKHEKLHNPSGKYSCDLCGYRYINKSHLKEHKIRYCRFKVNEKGLCTYESKWCQAFYIEYTMFLLSTYRKKTN